MDLENSVLQISIYELKAVQKEKSPEIKTVH